MILFILPSVRPAVVRSDSEEVEEEAEEEAEEERRGRKEGALLACRGSVSV